MRDATRNAGTRVHYLDTLKVAVVYGIVLAVASRDRPAGGTAPPDPHLLAGGEAT